MSDTASGPTGDSSDTASTGRSLRRSAVAGQKAWATLVPGAKKGPSDDEDLVEEEKEDFPPAPPKPAGSQKRRGRPPKYPPGAKRPTPAGGVGTPSREGSQMSPEPHDNGDEDGGDDKTPSFQQKLAARAAMRGRGGGTAGSFVGRGGRVAVNIGGRMKPLTMPTASFGGSAQSGGHAQAAAPSSSDASEPARPRPGTAAHPNQPALSRPRPTPPINNAMKVVKLTPGGGMQSLSSAGLRGRIIGAPARRVVAAPPARSAFPQARPIGVSQIEKNVESGLLDARRKAVGRFISGTAVSEFNQMVDLLNMEITRLQQENDSQVEYTESLTSLHLRRIKQLEQHVERLQKQLRIATRSCHTQLLSREDALDKVPVKREEEDVKAEGNSSAPVLQAVPRRWMPSDSELYGDESDMDEMDEEDEMEQLMEERAMNMDRQTADLD